MKNLAIIHIYRFFIMKTKEIRYLTHRLKIQVWNHIIFLG